MASRLFTALLLCVALTACDQVRRTSAQFLDNRTPRERYEAALTDAGLQGTALVRDWVAAGKRALDEAPVVGVLHKEEGSFDPASPAAFAFRLRVERGQAVSLAMDLPGDTSTRVFLDAWEVTDTIGTLKGVAAADSGARVLVFEPRRGAVYVLRAQPELLRGGRFTLTLRAGPTLAFPVLRGRDTDIGSRFGASRDGGARRHHGIDIFARRGTPALATGEAVVTRVDSGGLGGLVVWLRDQHGNRLYYAHLDSQTVKEGARVTAGDTVGFVGNTGNARTTPAHLHFGIYRRGEGPVDPQWFVHRVNGALPRLTADTTLLGGWARTRRPALLLTAPDTRAATRDSVPRHATVEVLAVVGRWYRIRLEDGRTGYLPATRLQGPDRRATAE